MACTPDLRLKKRIRLMALAICSAVGLSLSAQQFSFYHFGLADGLSNLSVRALAQDRAGRIWLATGNGLFRFDGNRFDRFGTDKGLAEDSINFVVAGPDGEIIAGTSSGVSVRDGNQFRALPAGEAGGAAIRCIGTGCMDFLPGGAVIAATPGGLGVLEGGAFRILPETRAWNLRAVYVAPDGWIWASSLTTVHRGRVGTDRRIAWDTTGQPWGLPTAEYGAPVMDGARRVWIRSRDALYVLEPGASEFRVSDLLFPPVGRLASLAVDPHGHLWVPAFNGLWHRDENESVAAVQFAEWTSGGSGQRRALGPVWNAVAGDGSPWHRPVERLPGLARVADVGRVKQQWRHGLRAGFQGASLGGDQGRVERTR